MGRFTGWAVWVPFTILPRTIVAADEEGNPVTQDPNDAINDPSAELKAGVTFADTHGNEYEILSVGDTDLTTGEVPIVVGRLMTLTFDLDGGILGDKTGSFTVKAVKNSTITIPEKPTKAGYTFQYWEGSEYYPGQEYKVEDDHNFKAKWTITPKYTDVRDEDGKAVTPKEPLTDPKVGDKFTCVKGNKYEIVSLGEPDPETGVVKVSVKKITDGSNGGSKDSDSKDADSNSSSNNSSNNGSSNKSSNNSSSNNSSSRSSSSSSSSNSSSKSSSSSSSNSSSGYSSGARAVNTGDSNNILLWVCALLISMSVLFALKRRRG